MIDTTCNSNLVLWQKKEYVNMKPGLSRIRRFLKTVGNPQDSFPCVHIAGTNGKGSTAKIISAILENSGYKTALYISPHLVRINERIQINSKPISNAELDSLTKRYFGAAHKYALSFFEFITAIAFIYFAQKKIDIAVIETGLGGRFDATNVASMPLVSVITDVDFDHKEILGNKLGKIAFEKAGIIKHKCSIISGVQRRAAENVIKKISRVRNCRLYEIGSDFDYRLLGINWKLGFQIFKYLEKGLAHEFKLSLLGKHQAKNCSIAIKAARELQDSGYNIDWARAKKALSNLRWNGRFEIIRKRNKTIILDGAHNPGAIRRFMDTLKQSPWGKNKQTFIFGVLKDKNYKLMIKILAEIAKRVILSPINSSRALSSEMLSQCWRKYLSEDNIEVAHSLKEAFEKTKNEKVVIITGSLYLSGEVLKKMGTEKIKYQK